jgi:hypothetical protein
VIVTVAALPGAEKVYTPRLVFAWIVQLSSASVRPGLVGLTYTP